ncbi:MAG: aldehyde dehydrogenase family protein, partial [Janthinobacterium lividum]
MLVCPGFHGEHEMSDAPGAVSRDPATGVVIERFAFQGSGEVERLLAGAEAAFRVWRDMPVGERARV